MLRTLLSGFVLALCAAVVLMIGGGSDLEHVALLGAALGGVIGLVPHDPPLGKLGGFALGFGVSWIAFGIRAAVLPDSTTGRAVATFLVILICGLTVPAYFFFPLGLTYLLYGLLRAVFRGLSERGELRNGDDQSPITLVRHGRHARRQENE